MEELLNWLGPELTWFLIGIILLVLELVIPGLVLFFFGVSAWIISLILLFVDISATSQVSLFTALSIVLIFTLREKLKFYFQGQTTHSEIHEIQSDFIGKQVTVTETIKTNGFGKIELNGTNWKAKSEDTINIGESAEIIKKDNLTLIVKKL